MSEDTNAGDLTLDIFEAEYDRQLMEQFKEGFLAGVRAGLKDVANIFKETEEKLSGDALLKDTLKIIAESIIEKADDKYIETVYAAFMSEKK